MRRHEPDRVPPARLISFLFWFSANAWWRSPWPVEAPASAQSFLAWHAPQPDTPPRPVLLPALVLASSPRIPSTSHDPFFNAPFSLGRRYGCISLPLLPAAAIAVASFSPWALQDGKKPANGEPCAGPSAAITLPVYPWSRRGGSAAAIRRRADCPPRTFRSVDQPQPRTRSFVPH